MTDILIKLLQLFISRLVPLLWTHVSSLFEIWDYPLALTSILSCRCVESIQLGASFFDKLQKLLLWGFPRLLFNIQITLDRINHALDQWEDLLFGFFSILALLFYHWSYLGCFLGHFKNNLSIAFLSLVRLSLITVLKARYFTLKITLQIADLIRAHFSLISNHFCKFFGPFVYKISYLWLNLISLPWVFIKLSSNDLLQLLQLLVSHFAKLISLLTIFVDEFLNHVHLII